MNVTHNDGFCDIEGGSLTIHNNVSVDKSDKYTTYIGENNSCDEELTTVDFRGEGWV